MDYTRSLLTLIFIISLTGFSDNVGRHVGPSMFVVSILLTWLAWFYMGCDAILNY